MKLMSGGLDHVRNISPCEYNLCEHYIALEVDNAVPALTAMAGACSVS